VRGLRHEDVVVAEFGPDTLLLRQHSSCGDSKAAYLLDARAEQGDHSQPVDRDRLHGHRRPGVRPRLATLYPMGEALRLKQF